MIIIVVLPLFRQIFLFPSTPKLIQSDNAGEFIQGKNIIKSVFNDLNTYETHQKLHDDLSITWYHAPCKSPSHSGVIERIVGTIKNH